MEEEKIKASQENFEKFIKGFEALGEHIEQLDALMDEELIPTLEKLVDELKIHRFEMVKFREKTANLKNLFGFQSK